MNDDKVKKDDNYRISNRGYIFAMTSLALLARALPAGVAIRTKLYRHAVAE